MAVDVLMPVISSAGEEAVVTAWFVDDGQACAASQLIAEVQAEKVSQEIEAPEAGFVVNRVAIGDPVQQGAPICRIVESVESSAAESAPDSAAAPAISATTVLASPAAKRVARELGVDISTIRGSGPGGRITESDVRRTGETSHAMTGLRATIARNMRRSHAETAPVTLFSTVHLGPELPDRLTARVVKTVAGALTDHLELNGTRDGDVFVPSPVPHVALAIQTDDGLVAPVVRDPNTRSLEDVATAVSDLAERARSKRLEASDFEGGTFSVSNLGSYGIDGFTPIIN
ncbi:MAG: 2-oxo acid dehydrogenase subunit E2, partial [Acidimicrobiia bacterium]|nr:2-oxo acid dehydrogenase subunit E2 [Acidimicrobiia bacterium]